MSLQLKDEIKKISSITVVSIFAAVITYIFYLGLEQIPFFSKYFPYNLIGLIFVAIYIHKTHFRKSTNLRNIVLTLLIHYFGGSVGREGVAIKIGYNIGKYWDAKIANKFDHKLFKAVGMSSGFSCLFGTPLAASFFATEKMGRKYVIYDIYAGFIGFFISKALRMHHFHFYLQKGLNFKFIDIVLLAIITVLCSLLYIFIKKGIASRLKFDHSYYLIVIGIIIYLFVTKGRYDSLGVNLINSSFKDPSSILKYDFILKLIITGVCTGIGFYGGEVTPLFAMGSTLGVMISMYTGSSPQVLAAVGLVGMFGGSTKTVLSPIFMGIELFGYNYVYLYIIICVINKYTKKELHIYKKGEFS